MIFTVYIMVGTQSMDTHFTLGFHTLGFQGDQFIRSLCYSLMRPFWGRLKYMEPPDVVIVVMPFRPWRCPLCLIARTSKNSPIIMPVRNVTGEGPGLVSLIGNALFCIHASPWATITPCFSFKLGKGSNNPVTLFFVPHAISILIVFGTIINPSTESSSLSSELE
uniref:Uncharacterized protein n=1 Tax=Timema cristinae TaxID=61476 RepID=A0A7R9HCT5_TIMCR|nr:unnamed protein product [Timema cristinae]